jgi:hypothetical protein
VFETLIETVNKEKELTTAGGLLGAIAAAVEAVAPEHRGDRKATRLLRLRCFKPQTGTSTCRFPGSIYFAHTADNSGMFASTSNTDTTSKTK